LGRARELLNRHRPRPGDKDLRGWEWRYLWQQCRSDALGELCHGDTEVYSLSVSHDGRWLAVVWQGDELSVWDLHVRRQIARLPAAGGSGGEGEARTAFSPREPLLAYSSSSRDQQGRWRHHVHLWDPLTHREQAQVELNQRCTGLAFAQDGQTLLTSTWGPKGELTCWQVRKGTELKTVPAPQTDWDEIAATPFAATADLSAAAVAPPGSYGVIDLTMRKQRWSNNDSTGGLSSMTFSPDARILAVSLGSQLGSHESGIHLFDAVTGKPLGPPLEGHLAWVGAMVFWPDGRTLASASGDQTIRLWDVSDPARANPIGRPLRGHTQEVWRLALLPDRRTLISGAKDGSVYLWDTSTARLDRSHLVIPDIRPDGWDFGSDGTSLVTIDRQHRVMRWQGPNFQDPRPVMQVGDSARCTLPLDHCGLLTACFSDGAFRIWDLNSMRELLAPPGAPPHFIAMTPERCLFLYTGEDNEAIEWDPVNARQTARWRAVDGISAYTFTPDGRWRVAMSYGGTGSIMDAATERQTPFKLAAREVNDACFSPDGKFLAIASEFGPVKLWETAELVSGGKLSAGITLPAFTLAPHSVAFSPEGRLAAGGGGSEAVKLYDVDSRQEVLTLPATGFLFERTKWSPDGSVLSARNGRGELHLWRAPSWAEIDAAEARQAAR